MPIPTTTQIDAAVPAGGTPSRALTNQVIKDLASSVPANLGRVLLGGGIPFAIPSSGTIGNNGAITLGTAFLTTHPSIYLYLPAGAIVTGSAAGWYYAVMSSATAGVVYNNVYTTGQPTIPASPAAFATTGPGAYAGVTGYINGPTATVPAGLLGVNGQVEWNLVGYQNSSAGSKQVSPNLGGSFISGYVAAASSAAPNSGRWLAVNCGVQNRQSFHDSYVGQPGYATGGYGTASIDTSINQIAAITLQHAVATDWVMLLNYGITAIPNV